MSTLSASHVEANPDRPIEHNSMTKPAYVKIWDVPVRLVHWLLVICFTGAYLTAESESWRLLHITLGYTMGGLIAFRIAWGLIGSRYARFSEFIRGPVAIISYLKSLIKGTPEHYSGHNPAGAVAVILLLGSGLAIAFSGYALYNDMAGEWLEEVHELAANGMLALVIVHIAAVLISSQLHRENLPRAMIDGNKRRPAQAAITSTSVSIGILILLVVAAFWYWQWQQAPAGMKNNLSGGSAVSGQQSTTQSKVGAVTDKSDDDD